MAKTQPQARKEPLRNEGVPKGAACSTCDRYQGGTCYYLALLREGVARAPADTRKPSTVFAEWCHHWLPLPDPELEALDEASIRQMAEAATGTVIAAGVGGVPPEKAAEEVAHAD